MVADETLVQRSKYVGLDLGADHDNPFPLYRTMRETTPVMEGDFLDRFGLPSQTGFAKPRPKFTLFRYADIMAVLRDPVTYSSSVIGEGLGQALGDRIITAMDGEEHRKIRGLLAPCFDMRLIALWGERMVEPVIREDFARPLIERGDKRAELVRDFAAFPMRVIYQILGLPHDPEMRTRFATLALYIKESMAPTPSERSIVAGRELLDIVASTVRQRRAEGGEGDDMIALLLRSEFEGEMLDDEAIAHFVRMLIPAAVETTSLSFQNMMTLLLSRPELVARVRDNPALVTKVVAETMRYESPATFLARVATRDVEIAGVSIPEGAALSLAASSANRDDAAFADGDDFDIDRKMVPALGFGFGPHMCVGQHIARLELTVALKALLDMLPNLRLDPAFEPPVIRGIIKRGPQEIRVMWD